MLLINDSPRLIEYLTIKQIECCCRCVGIQRLENIVIQCANTWSHTSARTHLRARTPRVHVQLHMPQGCECEDPDDQVAADPVDHARHPDHVPLEDHAQLSGRTPRCRRAPGPVPPSSPGRRREDGALESVRPTTQRRWADGPRAALCCSSSPSRTWKASRWP